MSGGNYKLPSWYWVIRFGRISGASLFSSKLCFLWTLLIDVVMRMISRKFLHKLPSDCWMAWSRAVYILSSGVWRDFAQVLVYSLDVLLWEAKLASVVSSLLRSYYNLQKVSLGTTELYELNFGVLTSASLQFCGWRGRSLILALFSLRLEKKSQGNFDLLILNETLSCAGS
jgi:hypothetical protein